LENSNPYTPLTLAKNPENQNFDLIVGHFFTNPQISGDFVAKK